MDEAAHSRGFIFAATGRVYVTMARRAARTLRTHHPDAQIDLFTDLPTGDDVFDVEHDLSHSFFRPKIEALRRSRFDRTVYLDTDTIVLMPVGELFDAVEHCDLAAVPGLNRTRVFMPRKGPVSRALPMVNSGVIALRKNERSEAFLTAWEERLRATGMQVDQTSMRRFLYTTDLRFHPLGLEYNMKFMNLIDFWQERQGTPRILHCSNLHSDEPGDPLKPVGLREVLGPRRVRRLSALMMLDRLAGSRDAATERQRDRARATLKETAVQSANARNMAGQEPEPAYARAAPRPDKGLGGRFAPYSMAVMALAAAKPRVRICVIGARRGHLSNPSHRLLQHFLPTRSEAVLIEAQPDLAAKLAETYTAHDACHVMRAVIGAEGEGPPFGVSQAVRAEIVDVFGKGSPEDRSAAGLVAPEGARIAAWVAEHLPHRNGQGAVAEEVDAPLVPLRTALQQNGIPTEIDVLHIDSEVDPDDVLAACEVETTCPAILLIRTGPLRDERRRALSENLAATYEVAQFGAFTLAVRRVPA